MNLFHVVKYSIIVVLFTFCHGLTKKEKEKKEQEELDAILYNTYHTGYRKVNWCVTGKDEPELHEWPFNQFNWYLRKAFHRTLAPYFHYDLRFFDIFTKQKHTGLDGRLYKTMHVVLKAWKRKKITVSLEENWEPMEIEGVIIQANSNPYTLGLPTGQFFEPGDKAAPKETLPDKEWHRMQEVNCVDCSKIEYWARPIACRKRAKVHIEHPTIMAWHHLQPFANISDSEKIVEFKPGNLPPVVKRQSEVHANFRFFSPKCAATRRMSFIVLVVRSFIRHEYDLFVQGPHEVTVRDQEFLSDIHPSPYFVFYTQQAICHHPSASDLYLEKPQKFTDFEMNHFFDCCIREEENLKSEATIQILKLKGTKSTSCYEKLYKNHDPAEREKKRNERSQIIELGAEEWWCFYPFYPKCLEGSEEADFEHAITDYRPCPPCIVPTSTPALTTTSHQFKLIKRSPHGFLMIMTNFCLQPLVIYIARFYKETFNLKQKRGNKMWYWYHFFGGMVSSAMVYFGYFAGTTSKTDILVKSHINLGYGYMITLVVCYISAWGRHKNTLITTIAEFVHGCMGYITIALAAACIATVPEETMDFIPKLFCLLMLATQGFFMIILTCNICLLDKKIGMRPRRRHFPTVEARFDEIVVPGNKFRTICLIIFGLITFGLSVTSLFLP